MEKLHFCRKLRPALLHLASQQCRLPVDVLALKIHMSEEAYSALMAFPDFITECRGDIPVKVEYLIHIFKITFSELLFVHLKMLEHP